MKNTYNKVKAKTLTLRDLLLKHIPELFLKFNTIVGTGVVGLAIIFGSVFFFPNLPKDFANFIGLGGEGKDYQYPTHEKDDVVFLDQGWNEGFRHQYYYTPQGSQIIPLDMALALEGPETGTYFFGDNGLSVTKYGYLPYPKTDEEDKTYKHNLNPYGLPIGFTIDGHVEKLSQLNHKITQPMLGMNCAACHTSNMEISGKTVRIEGNQAMGDFMGLFTAMDNALAQTYSSDARFKRFKARLDGIRADMDLDIEPDDVIRDKLAGVVRRREAWQRRNSPDINPGHGRVDAFGVIFNQVTARDLHLDSRDRGGNARTPNAPVSYPVLWDTPHMARVQWNGSANNVKSGGVLGRNFGQVMGVFGATEVTKESINPGHCSTVKRRNLDKLNYWVRSLNSPKWNDPALAGLLPGLDATLLDIGANIYKKKCQSCHAVISDSYREVAASKKETCDIPITVVDVDIVKTDPQTALTGTREGAITGILEGLDSSARAGEVMAPTEPYVNVIREVVTRSIVGSFQTLTCEGETSAGALIEATAGFGKIAKSRKGKAKDIGGGFDWKPTQEFTEKGARKQARDPESECGPDKTVYKYKADVSKDADSYYPFAYRARPLNGIWASAPYLHNGSVPTLYDMLSAPKDRPSLFHVGNTEYDPEKIGFKTTPGDATTEFNTRLPGNTNVGHAFSTGLSEADKTALLEYLKSL